VLARAADNEFREAHDPQTLPPQELACGRQAPAPSGYTEARITLHDSRGALPGSTRQRGTGARHENSLRSLIGFGWGSLSLSDSL
jgi:hypothetical protein